MSNIGSKMNSETILDVLDILIGKTTPVGDSIIDRERFENLKTKIDIVNALLDDLYYSAEQRKSDFGSIRDNGERAYAAMLEWKQWLQDVEEELA